MTNPTSSRATGEIVHRLPRAHVHLFQHNKAPDAYYNEKGCGAFTTSMALSFYDPPRFGTYASARAIFDSMLKVPFFGGTFESQNASIGRRFNFATDNYDHGHPADLAAAIDCEAPTILLVNPNSFGIGQHDVLLVGYSADAQGRLINFFVDNPGVASDTQTAPPGLSYPGNETYPVATLPKRWTRCFTPFFPSRDIHLKWRMLTNRL
ncbi:MAG: hypothetical protein WCD37_02195 [Chloroflexia bacterium]